MTWKARTQRDGAPAYEEWEKVTTEPMKQQSSDRKKVAKMRRIKKAIKMKKRS